MGVLRRGIGGVTTYYVGLQCYLVYHLKTAPPNNVQPNWSDGSKGMFHSGMEPVSAKPKLESATPESREPMVQAVLSLYQSKPSLGAMEFYAPEATVEDPCFLFKGKREIAAAWYNMVKFIPTSETLSYKVDHSEDWVRITVNQKYCLRGTGLDITLPSVAYLTLTRTDEGKELIINHTDEWYGKPLLERSNHFGFELIGTTARMFRRVHGWIVTRYSCAPNVREL
ncbi:hypothetical protein Bbelb_206610 [Branchiostoma belcheri]|nr:hypothetical protein Bbelb_206610 [Branchiostoma belcheri]